MPAHDGPRVTTNRGQRRRSLLIDTAAQVLTERGFAAVSHRAVATRAGLPLASTTYYFSSLDELREAALTNVAERWLAEARKAASSVPEGVNSLAVLAQALVDVVAPAQGAAPEVTTLYERYLEAGRHPRLRPVIARFDAHVDELVVEVLRRGGRPCSPDHGRLLLAAIDGLIIRAMAQGRPVGSVTAGVEQLLALLPAGDVT